MAASQLPLWSFHATASAAAPDYSYETVLSLPFAVSIAINAILVTYLLCAAVRRSKQLDTTSAPPKAKPTFAAVRSTEKKVRAKPVVTSVPEAIQLLKATSEGNKYLEAGDLLDAIRSELSKSAGSAWGNWGNAEAQQQLDALLANGELEGRIKTARDARQDLSSDDGFELVQQDATMKVLQRLTPARELTVKIEAVLEGVNPGQCLMIWREASLFPLWFPFVTGGKILADVSPSEMVCHILVETFFMSVDMCLWGWACDNMDEGETLLCVRPVRSYTKNLPPGVKVPPPGAGATKSTLLGALRAHAVIDILVEPLDGSVRFAFQMSDTLPPFMPSWAINYVVQNAMVEIFGNMKKIATKMAKKDPSSEHLQHVNRPEYKETKAWVNSLLGE